MIGIRNGLIPKRNRCHYNFKGKVKMSFETESDAKQYINNKNLVNYIIYLCKYCNKYHISHRQK